MHVGSPRSRWLALGYAVALFGALGLELTHSPSLPHPVTLVFFVGLILWAEHGAVLLPSEIRVSPSFMVIMASIAAFGDNGVVLGAAIVGCCSGHFAIL